jgi:hypothetical protein
LTIQHGNGRCIKLLLGSNAMAGFLLGVLLLFIGVAGFLLSGKQTVVVDPKSRRITIEDTAEAHAEPIIE